MVHGLGTTVKYLVIYPDRNQLGKPNHRRKILKLNQIIWLTGRRSQLSLNKKLLLCKKILVQYRHTVFNFVVTISHPIPKYHRHSNQRVTNCPWYISNQPRAHRHWNSFCRQSNNIPRYHIPELN